MCWLAWSSANAVPQFSREYDRPCSACHTAWPQLNQKGREFKENGYRDVDEVGQNKSFENFPISTVLVARPYDKKASEDHARAT